MLLAVLVALSAGGVCASVSASEALEPAEPRRVLVIFPTEPAEPIAVLLDQGVRDALRAPDGGLAPPVVFTEYLELSRLPEPTLQRAQLDWLRRKYAERPPDAVIAFGTSTARALGALGQPLIPGAVTVFAALDPLLFPDLALPQDADVLWLRYDVGETLGAALRLQPAARLVLLVAGTAPFDQAMLAHARQEVAPYAGRVSIEAPTDLSLDELTQHLGGLPPDTVVVFLSLNRDGAGSPLPSDEALRRVVAAGPPVYTNTETSVGGGVVGGAVTSYATLGAEAARAVLRRLADPDARPLSRPPADPKFVFDWRQLQRWGLSEDRLPPASEVRFRPPSLMEQYGWQVSGALLLIVAQCVLVAGLLVERSHRRRAQTALAERQEDLVQANEALRGRTHEVEERNLRIRTLVGSLLRAQEQERAHIACDLHDEVGQALTAAKIELDTLRLTADRAAPPSSLAASLALIDHALEQVRDLSLLLRPALLDHLGLEAALRWLVQSQAQRVGYRATFTAEKLEPPPSPELQITCYRIAQEALTNIARHARAQNVVVDLRAADAQLCLVIRDDGDGFDPAAVQQRAREGGSMGLLSLEERARLVNGRLSIDSGPGRGTILVLSLPFVVADRPDRDERLDPGPAPAPSARPGA